MNAVPAQKAKRNGKPFGLPKKGPRKAARLFGERRSDGMNERRL